METYYSFLTGFKGLIYINKIMTSAFTCEIKQDLILGMNGGLIQTNQNVHISRNILVFKEVLYELESIGCLSWGLALDFRAGT